MKKFSAFYLLLMVVGFTMMNSVVYSQTSVQNFGTGTGSNTSQTGSTSLIPAPTSGTTYARAGITVPAAPVVIANTSNPLGTAGSYVRAVASTSASVTKMSPIVSYTSGTEFYTSFKILFGNSSGGNTATSGTWAFYQGNQGTNYTDNTDVSNANVFTGLKFTFGASGALTLTYNNAGSYNSTGLTSSAYTQATVYTIEIVGNNKTSGTISYTYNGVGQTVAVQKFDLYINGTLVGNDLAKGGLTANTAINATAFTGVSSTSNAANIFVDDVSVYNAVPSSIGTPPAGTPTKLVVSSVNSGLSPSAIDAFSVTVQSQDVTNTAANVSTNTDFSLSLGSGTGILGGTLSGTIPMGTSSITISGVTYNTAESGVSITATKTAGDALAAGTSSTFTVLGAPTQLTLLNVPAAANINSALSSFTVEARRADNSKDGNFTGNITITKTTGSGTLSGTVTKAAIAGVATFNDLKFDQEDTYTISAASGSLTGGPSADIAITVPHFTAGNLALFVAAVYNSGNTTGSIVEIDHAALSVQPAINSYAIDGSVFRFSGSGTSTGYLSTTSDGTLLSFAGANTTSSANVTTISSRGVGTLDNSFNFNLATTYTGDGASGNQVRGATSLDNSTWYIADQGGLYTNLSSAASPAGNFRSVKPFGGVVYGLVSSTTNPVGVFTAASGGTFNAFTMTPATAPADFYMVSSASNGIYDIMYLIANTSATAGVIYKYSLVNGVWTANGSYITGFGGFGIAAKPISVGSAFIYISTGNGATSGNSVLRLMDGTGYNSTISISGQTTLYTAAASNTVKGIAFAPRTLPPATKLAVGLVNGGTSPSVGDAFTVTVQAQDASGDPATVAANTNVSISLLSGTGTLSGTLTGIIPAGSSSVIISGVFYNKAETGVNLNATRTSGDVLTSGIGVAFTVLGPATKVVLVNTPTAGFTNSAVNSFTAEVRRADNSLDLNYSGNVTIAKFSGPAAGVLSGTLTKAVASGIASFSGLQFSQAGIYTVKASAGSLATNTSGNIVISGTPTLTEVIFPQYAVNGATTGNRLQWACRLTLGNLAPNATYRYITNAGGAGTMYVINNTSSADGYVVGHTSNKSLNGTLLTGDQFAPASAYGQFTTNNSGTYTGWFTMVPTNNGVFTPPANVSFNVQINDGAGGTSVAATLTSASTITMLNPSAGGAQAVRGVSNATAENMIFVYNNTAGTGRPLYGTWVENDGITTTFTTWYNPAAGTKTDGVNGSWGVYIPAGTGIKRIEQRNVATGSIVNCPAISNDGSWPGGVHTETGAGGTTALVITASDAPLDNTNTWVGGNSNWNNPANWSCGVPNSSTSDVIIPSNAPAMPKLIGDITVRNIVLYGTSTMDLAAKTLTVTGSITGSGKLKGSDFAGLILGGSAGTLNFATDYSTLKLLTLNSGATATLGTALDITSANNGGMLTVNAGATFNAGNNLLTIKSGINGTASVATSAGIINGNVTVERFIPAYGHRAWRLLSVPTAGSQTINTAWQEGQAAMANGHPGYGVLLTSAAGGNGYDAQTAGNSFLNFKPGNPGTWSPVPATTITIANDSGYMVYVRGDRSSPLTGGIIAQSATTLRTNGTLYQGDQTPITFGQGINKLIGNIYASAIDFTALPRSAGITSFKVWDPKIKGTSDLGGFQTFAPPLWQAIPGGGSYGNRVNTRIESGQAFMVNSISGNGSVQLTEAAKVSGSYNNVFRTASLGQFKASLIAYTTDGLSLADGNYVVFDSAYSSAVDNDDVTKINNFGENFGVLRDGYTLALEARMPVVNNDTIFYKMWNVKQQQYRLEFVATNMDKPGFSAMLEDKFLNTTIPLNTVDTTNVDFTITSNAASYAQDRFRVIMKVTNVMPVTFTNISAMEKDRKINVTWKVATEQNIDHYEAERSSDGRNFEKTGSVKAKGNSQANDYSFIDQQPFKGDNFYRVKAIEISGKGFYSAVVKVKLDKENINFSVNPNPIVNNELNLQFNNKPKGVYNIMLMSATGQLIFNKMINYDGGNNTKTIILPSGIATGVYQLEIMQAGQQEKNIQKLIISNN